MDIYLGDLEWNYSFWAISGVTKFTMSNLNIIPGIYMTR